MCTGDDDSAGRRGDLLFLLLFAGLVRAVYLIAVPRVVDTADAVHYLEAAAAFARGGFFEANPKIPILYPLLGALVALGIGDLEWACRWVSFVASTLLVLPVYLLARDLHGRDAARLAGAAVGLWPWLADYGCAVATEPLAVLLWMGGVWLLSRGARGSMPTTLLALGAFAGLYLTRPEGMLLLLAAPFAAAALVWPPDVPARRRVAALAGGAGTVLALNTLYVRALSGSATANYRVRFIFEEFDLLRFAHTAWSTLADVFPIMMGPAALLFLGAGFFLPRARPRDFRLEGFVLGFAALQWAASWFVLSPAPRYLMAPLVVLLLWSACGVALVARAAAPLRAGRVVRWLPAAALFGTLLVHTAVTLGSEHAGRRPRQPREYKAAGLWMKEHLEPGLIFTRKPQVAWYAGMPSTGPAADDSLDAAVARARAARARYLVVDERYAPAALRVLLDPDRAPAGLEYLRHFDLYPQARVVIYRIGE